MEQVVASGAERYRLGRWTFLPASHELIGAAGRVSLERRAARALQMLCEQGGEVVPTRAFLSRLWDGRQVSDNSLAIVIADLRRALGDDARAPTFIGTVAKSGYRLLVPVEVLTGGTARGRRGGAAAGAGAAFFLICVSAGAWAVIPRTTPRSVLVGAVVNETGDPRYDALAKACGEHLLGDLSQQGGLNVVRQGPAAPIAGDDRAIRLTAKLVLWSGLPDVVMTAEDARTSQVIWSGFAFGTEDALPGNIQAQIDRFAAKAKAHG